MAFAQQGVVMHNDQSYSPHLAMDDSTTDFVIECQGEVFRFHKSVLIAHSGYFKNCLRFTCGKVQYQMYGELWHIAKTRYRSMKRTGLF